MGTQVRRHAVLLAVIAGLIAIVLSSSAAAATTTNPASSPYVPALNTSPTVATIQDGTSVAAPYNLSQGITNFDSLAISPYPSSDLLPTFSFGGPTTSADAATLAEPNIAVYPGASAKNQPEPFASGFAGSPGPLTGYCGTSYSDTWDTSYSAQTGNPNEGLAPLKQPAGVSLPFAPYYFPYITRNPDGSLTGYFDWRPKDADEAVVSATSSDGGRTWTATGEALEQNPGYCPSGDTNDDGLGHPYVAALDSAGAANDLYALQRADGDYAGSSLDTFSVNPAAANPLAGVQKTSSVGVDPNTFAAAATSVPASGGSTVNIPVSTLGGDAADGNSTSVSDGTNTAVTPDVTALPNGPAEYEDLTGAAAGAQPPVIVCTGTSGATGSSPALTGCASSNGTAVAVSAQDDLIEVIGTISKMLATGSKTQAATVIPYGPQNEHQTIGTDITLTPTSANSDTLTYLLNANAPNRYLIGGSTVYCAQGNAEPTTAIETCRRRIPPATPPPSALAPARPPPARRSSATRRSPRRARTTPAAP